MEIKNTVSAHYANKIIDMFRDERVSERDAAGALMVCMRFLCKDDKASSEILKAAVCKFIDSTVDLQNDD